jgi:HK97 family phage portal protein
MSTEVMPSGLVVTDRRHSRASREVPQIDPHDHLPNGNLPSSVGPESNPGRTVMYPVGGWHAQSWDGWPTEWQTPWMGPDGDWSGYGAGRHNGGTFGRVSTAMTCVDLNSRQLGSFPVYGMRGIEPFTLPDWRNNPEPELFDSWPDFMHSAVNSLLLRGETILYCTGRYANGWPARFTTINPDVMDIEFIDGHRTFTLAGEQLDPRDVNLTRYQSWPGAVRGVTPIEWIGQSMVTSGALEQYAAGLATRGGVPWAVLKGRGSISRPQAEEAQQRWVEAGRRRDGAPAVLGGDLDLQPVSISPKDMALLELRTFDEQRICAAFGVPAYLVNVAMADGLTYANASQLFEHHYRATLRVMADLLASSWSAWLLPRGSVMEFNPDRYVQPPLGERVNAWRAMFDIVDPATGERGMSVEEIRNAERLAPQAADVQGDASRLTGANI